MRGHPARIRSNSQLLRPLGRAADLLADERRHPAGAAADRVQIAALQPPEGRRRGEGITCPDGILDGDRGPLTLDDPLAP
jgi:hypothetical protein